MSARGFRVPYGCRTTRYVYVPMRDGVHLACDVHRPDAPGRFPSLMVRTPYGKGGIGREEAEFWARHGYALCVVDARGTGGSEGAFSYYSIPEGLGDGTDVVNWLAAQPFCDGRVGTYGASALGAYQLLAAAEQPAALKAMFVELAPLNQYLDNWFEGGVFRAGHRIKWLEGNTPNVSPFAPIAPVQGEVDPEGEARRRQVALERMQLREERALSGKCPTPQEWYVDMRPHTEYDEFWRRRNLLEVVRTCRIPTCYRGIWFDHFARATCDAYCLHPGPKQLLLQPGDQGLHGAQKDMDARAARLRWFDFHLRGIDDGLMDEPPVRCFIMGEERWRTFADWPPADGVRTLALSKGGRLVEPGRAAQFQDALRHDPGEPLLEPDDIQDIRPFEARALTYTMAPLRKDLTVAGEAVLRLRFRSASRDAHVIVRLADVFPDGRSRQLAFGALRAAHREGHEHARPLPAGKPADLSIRLWPTANTFLAGHRVRLSIAGSEFPRYAVYPEACTHTVIGAPDAVSTLELPVVGGP
jgi:putative CocE/NonD family hydrolase